MYYEPRSEIEQLTDAVQRLCQITFEGEWYADPDGELPTALVVTYEVRTGRTVLIGGCIEREFVHHPDPESERWLYPKRPRAVLLTDEGIQYLNDMGETKPLRALIESIEDDLRRADERHAPKRGES
jgi:hypothetical protein